MRTHAGLGPRPLALLLLALSTLMLTTALGAPAQAATRSLRISPVSSGTRAADPAGSCPAQAHGSGEHCPGLDTDLSRADRVLRTGDEASVRFEWSADGAQASSHVVLTGTTSGGAVWSADPPSSCDTFALTGGGRAFTCEVSDADGSSGGSVELDLSIPADVGDGVAVKVSGTVSGQGGSDVVRAQSEVAFISSASSQDGRGKDEPTASPAAAGDAAIAVDKKTNGVDAAVAPGPNVRIGAPVRWTYAVTNPGDVTLTDVTVTDDPAVAVDCGGGTNEIASLDPGSSAVTCTASGVAVAGQFENTATVTGTTPETTDADGNVTPGTQVSASDTSHYFGSGASLTLETLAQRLEADEAPGPYVPVGEPIGWTFVLTNTGTVELSDLAVVPDDDLLDVTCTQTILAPDEETICTASGAARSGENTLTATASASTPVGAAVTSESDPAFYFGGTTGLTVATQINSNDASSTAPGVLVPADAGATIRVVVTNTGDAPLVNVVVRGPEGTPLDCGDGSATITALTARAKVTCIAAVTATAGAFSVTGKATGRAPASVAPDRTTVPGVVVTATPSTAYAFGFDASLVVAKTVNGQAADTAPGVRVEANGTTTVRFGVDVTNPAAAGAVPIDDVEVTDPGVDLTCTLNGTPVDDATVTTLAVGDALSCTAEVLALPGQQVNNVLVTGTGPAPIQTDGTTGTALAVSGNDAAYYFGAAGTLVLTTTTNGTGDAGDDEAPGPLVKAGDPVAFTYVVSNPAVVGAETLAVTLADPALTSGSISCAGGGATIPALVPGQTVTCVVTGEKAAKGQYASTVTATSATRSASSPVHYFGTVSAFTVRSTVGDQDAAGAVLDTPTAPFSWTIVNTGNVELTDLTITTPGLDLVGPTSCGPGSTASLAVGDSLTCTSTVRLPANSTTRGDVTVTASSPVTSAADGTAVPGTAVQVADPVLIVREAPGTSDPSPGTTATTGSGGGSGSSSHGNGLASTGSAVPAWFALVGLGLVGTGAALVQRRRPART